MFLEFILDVEHLGAYPAPQDILIVVLLHVSCEVSTVRVCFVTDQAGVLLGQASLENIVCEEKSKCYLTGRKIHRGSGELAPKSHKRAPKLCIEFNAKQNKECNFNASKFEK